MRNRKKVAADDVPRDWRGTPITIGATVIYGAGVGRSISPTEATVLGFTDKGNVKLHVVRRGYGGYSAENKPVHVMADRLTVVEGLAPSSTPTYDDRCTERAGWRRAYDAWVAGGCVGPCPGYDR